MLVVFFVAFNLFATVLLSTGAAAALHLDADVGGDETVDQAQDSEVDSGTSTGSTLFGMYNVLTEQVGQFFHSIMPGLQMLNRAGVPSYITGGILGPLFSVIIFVDLVSFLRGWGL